MDNPLVGAMTLVGVWFQPFGNMFVVSGLVSQRVGRGNNSLVRASACWSDATLDLKLMSLYQYIQVYAFPSF